jgi:hypothetical protein
MRSPTQRAIRVLFPITQTEMAEALADLVRFFSAAFLQFPVLERWVRRQGNRRLSRQLVQKFSQLGRRLELRHGIKLLESAGERI